MRLFLVVVLLTSWLLVVESLGADCDPVGRVVEGALVYHGSPVAVFTWRNPELNPAPPFDHPAAPDGPAWFADTWMFSVHAGTRFLQGQRDVESHLYRYRATRDLAVLSCTDHADFTAATGIGFDAGDYPSAVAFCRDVAPDQYNGYVIQEDRVREEPELILCNPAGVLELVGQQDWFVTQVEGGYTGATGRAFEEGEYGCLLNNDNLADFRCAPIAEEDRALGRLSRVRDQLWSD